MLSSVDNLNDPFELLGCDLTDMDIKKSAESAKIMSNSKHAVLCFSKNWINPVLWSHYADSHKGICLGYDINDDYSIEMKYVNSRLKRKFDENGNYDRNEFMDYIKLKYKHWSYEEEVRMVVDVSTVKAYNNRFYYHTNPVGESEVLLKEIIIGPRNDMPIEYFMQRLKCRNVNVDVLKTKLSDSHFKVVAV